MSKEFNEKLDKRYNEIIAGIDAYAAQLERNKIARQNALAAKSVLGLNFTNPPANELVMFETARANLKEMGI